MYEITRALLVDDRQGICNSLMQGGSVTTDDASCFDAARLNINTTAPLISCFTCSTKLLAIFPEGHCFVMVHASMTSTLMALWFCLKVL